MDVSDTIINMVFDGAREGQISKPLINVKEDCQDDGSSRKGIMVA